MHCWGEIPLPTSARNKSTEERSQLERNISAVSAGRETVAFVQKDGKGFFLFQGGNRGDKQKPRAFTLGKDRIRRLSCGESHIVLVSQKGKIFQLNCQESPSIPRSLNLCDKEVIQIACGDYHSIALTKEIPLARVAAGGGHSFALTLTGVVLAWGRNSKGQLGLGDVENEYFPIAVKSLRQQKTVYISCGEEHTAILTKGGLVFTFGAGQYGQLGHNSVRDELWPRLVAELWGAEVSQIACGRHHTLAYISSLKKVYACGRGEQGQLGSGMTCDQYVPLPVQELEDCYRSHCIERITAGGNQSFVFCSAVQTFKDSCIWTEDIICTLDDKLISKWVSKCDSKSWNTIKREINTIFSSASCLNGSFLKQGHQSMPDKLSVDLSLARLSFEKLAKEEKVMNKVESVVIEKLVPSLLPLVAGTEGHGVYLILPELMRVMTTHENCRDLSFAFASAVLRLHPPCLATLEDIWSKLPDTFFKSLVKVFHTVSTRYLHQICTKMWTQCSENWDLFTKTVEVLQKLYEVNLRAGRKIDDKNFYISEVKLLFQTFNKIHPESMMLLVKNGLMCVYSLTAYPCILDMDTKCLLFKSYIYIVIEQNAYHPIRHNNLFVNRSSLLTDTIKQLRDVPRNYSWPLQVKFAEEYGIDYGGVSQEFFSIAAKELHSARPTMFQFFEDSRLVWFISNGCDLDMFYLLGVLYGMALYNFCIMNLQFPVALFKKLLGIPTTLEDLEELSPVEACGLKDLLAEDEDFVEELYLDFTARGHELVPCGREIPVTKYNRQQYVDAYVHYVFNTSVQKEFDNFSKGFSAGCPNTKWKMFLPGELMAFLTGNINYEWEELRKNAKYKSYEPTDENIQNFWSVFTELSEQQKKNFLSYMTGSDRLPVGGLSRLHLTIANANKADPDIYYPVASTCYSILYLPNYSSIDILREKFLHAIKFYEEFGEA
ncbi:probable E3 ubiquitin-protein ligase HERC4 isoform X2 [Scleropages formosus]|uniref:probable E3 ubiquitin-protein ligase HERC4 isoform X2 n=1 Tax=Scleropages formosus TaxID=113540 RepID=UPI0010FA8326|nr:probable E3 ubiquitin-protein ligase HERC4 isoform X2 [Scleropages formosus]